MRQATGKPRGHRSPRKIDVTRKLTVVSVSVVTLIRTDTTLDHSQKAEKVCANAPRGGLAGCALGAIVAKNEYIGGRSFSQELLAIWTWICSSRATSRDVCDILGGQAAQRKATPGKQRARRAGYRAGELRSHKLT